MVPAAARLGESANDGFLSPVGLDFQPRSASPAGQVLTVGLLRDDPLEGCCFRGAKQGNPGAFDVLTQAKARQPVNDSRKKLLSPPERERTKIASVQVQDVEHV